MKDKQKMVDMYKINANSHYHKIAGDEINYKCLICEKNLLNLKEYNPNDICKKCWNIKIEQIEKLKEIK